MDFGVYPSAIHVRKKGMIFMSQEKKNTSVMKNMILNIVLVICTVAIIVCGVLIVRSLNDYQVAEEKNEEISSGMADLIDQLNQNKVPLVTSGTPETSAPGQTSATGADVTKPVEPARPVREEYREIHEYLTGLKKQYPDLFGWIHIEFDEDHVINLPVMQSDDNNYYIDHAYDGTSSKSGAVFADYRNTDRRIDLNQNLVFYGHNMNNKSMFALLSTQYKQRANFDEVPVVFYSMEGVYTFNVFSIYNGKAGDGYDTVAFSQDNLKNFCEELQKRSFYTKKLSFTGKETVLTLVTCTNYVTDADGRVLVHGVLDGYESFYD